MRLGWNCVGLECLQCKAGFLPQQVGYCCPTCGLDGALDVLYDHAAAGRAFRAGHLSGRPFDMWRYAELLPVDRRFAPPLQTGGTPLYVLKGVGPGTVLIKDDSRNPSGSLKDRASALAIAIAAHQNINTIAAASTGNAAAALACMSAGSGVRCIIFAPNTAAREKLSQIRAYGAEIVEVAGGYDEAFAACHAACLERGWYNRSTGINSYMTEGKKTVSFEIAEQMNWDVPDRIFVPVGNGGIVGAVYKGFRELMLSGVTTRMPRIMGVQASGSDYLHRAWTQGSGAHAAQVRPSETAASSISVALPRDRIKALRAIEASEGEYIKVEDRSIFEAVLDLARAGGVFAEPGAAAAYAGMRKWGAPASGERWVVLVTGSGLKDVAGLMKSGVLESGNGTVPQATMREPVAVAADVVREAASMAH